MVAVEASAALDHEHRHSEQSQMTRINAPSISNKTLFPNRRPTMSGSCHRSIPRRRKDVTKKLINDQLLARRRNNRNWEMVWKEFVAFLCRRKSWDEFIQQFHAILWINCIHDEADVAGSWLSWIRNLFEFHPLMYTSLNDGIYHRSSQLPHENSSLSYASSLDRRIYNDLIKVPEIDPYESWWHGKVSLFDFLMRHLIPGSRSEGAEHGNHHDDQNVQFKEGDEKSSNDGGNSSTDDRFVLDQNTLFEFRLLKVKPVKIGDEDTNLIDNGVSTSYSLSMSTNSPLFVLGTTLLLLHYLYLLFFGQSISKVKRRRSSVENIQVSPPSEFDASSNRNEDLPATHIYVKNSDDEIEDDDLTCSEAEDDFDLVPPLNRAMPVVPPLLQYDSLASTNEEEIDLLGQMQQTLNRVRTGNVPTYLNSSSSYSAHNSYNERPINPASNAENAMVFLDDSLTTFTASSDTEKFFICFVTEVTEAVSDPYVVNYDDQEASLKDLHDAWLNGMRESGTIVASGPYHGTNSNVGSSTKDGMLIIKASNYEQAQDIAMGDPYHQHCVCTFRIMPWNVSTAKSATVLSPKRDQAQSTNTNLPDDAHDAVDEPTPMSPPERGQTQGLNENESVPKNDAGNDPYAK